MSLTMAGFLKSSSSSWTREILCRGTKTSFSQIVENCKPFTFRSNHKINGPTWQDKGNCISTCPLSGLWYSTVWGQWELFSALKHYLDSSVQILFNWVKRMNECPTVWFGGRWGHKNKGSQNLLLITIWPDFPFLLNLNLKFQNHKSLFFLVSQAFIKNTCLRTR